MKGKLLASAIAAAASGASAQAAPGSGIRSVHISQAESIGTFGGIAYRRIQGTIEGDVGASEPVAGLREYAAGRAAVPYTTGFDLMLPDDPSIADGIVVEASNRGTGILAGMISAPKPDSNAARADGAASAGSLIGDGFLLSQRLSYARIQWQAGIASGVPETAQGMGQVIVRDFGRWLGGAFSIGRSDVPIFPHRILAGISQSAWLVNSFIAEGFNADPDKGGAVFQGAFTRNGNGNVLAINRFAAGKPQFAYVEPTATPLRPDQLLSRPESDPILVDIASLTDFYRVRASVFAKAPNVAGLHRYATAAAHAPAGAVPGAYIFGTLKCNGGTPIPLSPVSDALYLRPLILGLANAIGARTSTTHRLPDEALFELEPVPRDLVDINRLERTELWVPRTAGGSPVGGIPLLEASIPLGVAHPPVVGPVSVESMDDICGNFAGWRAFSAAELKDRYGSRARYLERARRQTSVLIRKGYLLAQDEAAAIDQLTAALPQDFTR